MRFFVSETKIKPNQGPRSSITAGGKTMNDRVDMFPLSFAWDHQRKMLEEAGLASRLRQAREQSEPGSRGPDSRGSALARWIADLLGLRSSKRLLG
jgi:hypothetical protein